MVDRVKQESSSNHLLMEHSGILGEAKGILSNACVHDNSVATAAAAAAMTSDSELHPTLEINKKEKGFETFLMTGEMIIRTTPSQKTKSVNSKGSGSEDAEVSDSMENGTEMTIYTATVFSEEKISQESETDRPLKSDQKSAESGFEEGNITDKDREKSASNITEPSSISDLSQLSSEDLTEISKTECQSSVSTAPTTDMLNVDVDPDQSKTDDNPDTSSPSSDPGTHDVGSETSEGGAKMVTSKSAEKFIINKGGQQFIVRTSKSQELQSENEFSIVSIDIDEDNKAYSLDQIPQPGNSNSTASLDHIMDQINSQGSRSLDSSPEHKTLADITNKGADKEFIPGFINLGDSNGKKSKTRDKMAENGATDHQEDDNFNQNSNGLDLGEDGEEDGEVEFKSSRDSIDPSQDPNFMDYHPPAKSVDRPSARRLAKRLYMLDGFKKSDVSRHLCKKNDFGSSVAEEYLKFFEFKGIPLDAALRMFLKQFSLIGETQERERVLAHFSRRYVDLNPNIYNSEDACHTLTCAIMLLNTDLHGQAVNRKMTCNEFVDNLADLNEGENFPRDLLKSLYTSIKEEPIEWALDEAQSEDPNSQSDKTQGSAPQMPKLGLGYNPFLDIPDPDKTTEYKSGYVMRKCCMDGYKKRTAMGKRSWRMCYAVLRDMVLYLYKDQHSMKKRHLIEGSHNIIRIHHSLAIKAMDYSKKQHVFRLVTAVGSEYLFQTSDSKELQNWIDTINYVAASLSAPQLPGAVGSQKKFERPLLPATYTRHNMQQQMLKHEEMCTQIESELNEHRKNPPEKGSKQRIIQEYVDKEAFLESEVTRYKTYVYLLQSRMASYQDMEPSLVETVIGEDDEGVNEVGSKSPQRKPVHRSLSDRTNDSTNGFAFGLPCEEDIYINTDTITTHL